MDLYELKSPVKEMAGAGIPIWGTCAGMIMMARELTEGKPVPMGLMDIRVTRNAFGRQLDSFEQIWKFGSWEGSPSGPCSSGPRHLRNGRRCGGPCPAARWPAGGCATG